MNRVLIVFTTVLLFPIQALSDNLDLVCEGEKIYGSSSLPAKAWSLAVKIDLDSSSLVVYETNWKETASEKSVVTVEISPSSITIFDTDSSGQYRRTLMISRVDGSLEGYDASVELGPSEVSTRFKAKCSKAADRAF